MHLKKIEMENFKSFGRKMTVPFLEGFTAITGPNGSGKSNIVDAILFVLGPKSSKIIRAGKLTDLIFNGGKEFKPPDYCRVTLVFDNTDRLMPLDEDEVRLTRLVKLSSTKENYYSYFYVNGHGSSLGEFDELLEYARISADGYNIVQQGDVTRIVEMGVVERRRILDGIAGISAFDADIEKAEKEKAEVDVNISTIRVLSGEIVAQLSRLANERDAAIKYKQLKEQHTLAKAQQAHRKKHNAETELASVQDNIVSYTSEKDKHMAMLTGLSKQSKEANAKLNELENKITSLGSEEGQKIKAQIDECRLTRDKASVSIENSQDEVRRLKNERAEIANDSKKLEKTIQNYGQEKANLEQIFAEKKRAHAQVEGEYKKINDLMTRSDDETRNLQKTIIMIGQQIEQKKSGRQSFALDADRFKEKRERLKIEIANLEDLYSKYEFEVKDITFALKECTKNSSSSDDDVKKAQDGLFKLKKEEAALAEEQEKLELQIRQLTRQYEQMKVENEMAESARKGYTRAVSAILEARDVGELRGIYGTIAELIKVDPQYETAIEIAAGYGMQSIVVETDEDGAKAIEHLKRKKIGRATFLPLNKVKAGMPKGQALLAVRNGLGFAMDLIKYDEKYKNAVWQVFRDTIIVDSLTTARRMMGGVRLVTLEGELIEASGAMVGGSITGNKIKLGAGGGDLEKLSKELRETMERQETVNQELKAIQKEINETYSKLTEEKSKLALGQSKLSDLEVKHKEYASKLESLRSELEANTKELKECERSLADATMKQEEDDKAIAALVEQQKEKRELLLKVTDQKIASKVRELEEQSKTLAREVMELQSKLDVVAEHIALNAERKKELTDKLNGIAQRLAEHEENITAQTRIVQESQEKLNVLLKIESEMSAELKQLVKERDELYKACVDLSSEIEKCQDKINVNEDLIIRARTRVQPLEDALRELQAEIASYGIEIAGDVPTLEELNKKIISFEQNMQNLEPVNMRAIDEYEETEARKARLDEESQQLNAHRENLISLVEEIKKKKKDNFYVVFNEVNTHFKETFARISAGGLAEIVLENPDDPFAGGLTLKSQPKGKKVLRLEALSGGEKSLTALSFIFAIQRYRPSPFYVLDEVDMFLDSVNSELISEVVKDNSKFAQFIMISLREVTLKNADHVYGVTMRPSGISELIGEIKLSDTFIKNEEAQQKEEQNALGATESASAK